MTGLPFPSVPDTKRAEILEGFVRTHRARFEAALAEVLPMPEGLPPALPRAAAAALGVKGNPGSRWRPLLTLAAARACGGDDSSALPVALAVELTHTASLILDDLPSMDDSSLRRSRAATHLEVGTGGAILLALSLLGRSAELLGSIPRSGGALAAEWGGAFGIAGMCGGQAVDLTGAFAAGGSPRRLHRKKTTGLSEFALKGAAIAVGAPQATESGLARFGRDLGWAYQLADDADDWAEDGQFGKGPAGRAPRRQSRRLLIRSLGTLRSTPGLDQEGRTLLEALAERTAGVDPERPEAEPDHQRWGMTA
ncbi:MAG: hypothetical protein EA351_09700 [Gemmatimonadales bacterium]|nr:MAG: hypothetical protein EA351_09700 [Gemmatimonadales bacterium]